MNKIKKIYIFLVALLIIVGGFLVYYLLFEAFDYNNSDETTNQVVVNIVRRLDGVLMDEENSNLLPIAVMIENHIEARPPSGLADALVVYEALSEGRITRFLAIYDLSQKIEKIGPIRSARPYYIELASEYGAIYVHSGGSPTALELLENDDVGVYDLNEYYGYNSGYFWRDQQRYSPHNLYTSSQLLFAAKEYYTIVGGADFVSWQFKDDESTVTNKVNDVEINYSASTAYQVTWKYNSSGNNYERYQSGSRHITDTGQIIEAKNIIIQFTETKILDAVGRRSVDLASGGEAVIFSDGKTTIGSWQKDVDRTRFFGESGDEIVFNRGITWIEIVDDSVEVIY
ncbi:MAG TPA: DUF3048 domain-containing protein [Patescibacteria group bacterium]|nr:DUF3048 domain-containing protein [Patescibacteria group bacterium]